jgi:hypothetical protein
MLKKYSIIALLLFSYTLVLGHSIIPHHHHNDDHEMEQSSHHHHDHHSDDHHSHDSDHQDNQDQDLSHDFANYFHLGETGDLHQQAEVKIPFGAIASAYIIASFDFKIQAFESPPPIIQHSKDHIPFLQRYLSSKGLRAPPCTLA